MNDNELERNKLFEEIRKRAEEAELARIEAEELRLNSISAEEWSSRLGGTQLDDASSTDAITADSQEIPEPTPSEKSNRQIEELFESANRYYQNEQYMQALSQLDEIIEARPGHSMARSLHADVTKAKDLSDRMAADERRAREAHAVQQTIELEEVLPVVQHVVEYDSGVFLAPEILADEKDGVHTKPKAAIRRRLVRIAFSLLVIFGLVTAYVLYRNFYPILLGTTKTIFIRPLQSVSQERWEREGLTIELIRRLSQVPSLRVIAPQTAFTVGNKDVSASGVSGVQYIIDWKTEVSGTTQTFSFVLTDMKSTRRILECSSSIPSDNLSEFSSDFIQKLTREFSFPTTPSEKGERHSAGISFRSYLRSLHLNHQGQTDSIAGMLTNALQRDPEFSQAEVLLGLVRLKQYEFARDTSLRLVEEASRHLQRALNLGNKSADAFRLWGMVEYCRLNFGNAVERLEQARDLAPGDASIHERLALAYLRLARIDDAISASRLQLIYDPLDSHAAELLSMLYLLQGKNALAAEQFERSANGSYSPPYLTALVESNRHERALDILRLYVSTNPGDYVSLYDLGRVSQLAGKPKTDWQAAFRLAMRIINDSLKANNKNAIALTYRALVQTRLGEFELSEKSIKQAMELAPADPVILLNAGRVLALQRNRSSEAVVLISRAMRQQFSLPALEDLDLASVRKDPQFATILLK